MAKTTVSNLINKILRRTDFYSSVEDSDLQALIIDGTNEALHELKQLLMDYGVYKDIVTQSSTFKTIANQAYRTVDKAVIVGNVATFTGIANDKIKVTIDGTAQDNIAIQACTTVALVATAINTAFAATVATVDANGYLQIESQTTGSTSSVTIADGSTTAQTVVGDLFSTAAERTDTALYDIDPNNEIHITERTDDRKLVQLPYDSYLKLLPDPTSNYATVPDAFSYYNNRFYFYPTPSQSALLYVDYVKLITEVISSSTLPFDNKYDPIVISKVVRLIREWEDESNATAIAAAQGKEDRYIDRLIISATRNAGVISASQSRNEIPQIGPRVPSDI